MDRAIANMQTDMGLKNEDINNFFKDSMAMKKNPYNWLAQGGTLQDLYYLVYREALMKAEIKKAVEEAKVQWEASSSKKPPVNNPARQSNDLRGTELSLNDLLTLAMK
jgi:prenyltransferase beta subunit